MRIPGKKALARALRPIRTRLAPGALILGYHRIADEGWDPLDLCVSPEQFRMHLDVLQEHLQPVPLRELVTASRDRRPTSGMVSITFDDGYADFLTEALPILESRAIPATVFVTTGSAGRPFWWDEISFALEPVSGAHAAAAAKEVQDLSRELLMAGDEQRERAIARLHERSSPSASTPPAAALTADQILRLAENDLVEIACHTVSHPLLAELPADAQRREIAESLGTLEEILGRGRITGFSYPNGSYNDVTRALAAELGFDYACTSKQQIVRPGADPYQLPRIWPPDAEANAFRRWLSGWCGGTL